MEDSLGDVKFLSKVMDLVPRGTWHNQTASYLPQSRRERPGRHHSRLQLITRPEVNGGKFVFAIKSIKS